ncbi:MAG: hypothetical protein H7331_08625 [Bacteroidia bacterium]|nr:hypothetical protein [Bacteroidia bacterium]
MITIEKVKIYNIYKGDVDGFGRASNRHRKIINHNEFSLLEGLIQDIKLIEKGLASENYISHVNKKLLESCNDMDTINYLKSSAINY